MYSSFRTRSSSTSDWSRPAVASVIDGLLSISGGRRPYHRFWTFSSFFDSGEESGRRSPQWLHGRQVFVDETNGHRALAHRGCDPLDRPRSAVSHREDTRQGRLER